MILNIFLGMGFVILFLSVVIIQEVIYTKKTKKLLHFINEVCGTLNKARVCLNRHEEYRIPESITTDIIGEIDAMLEASFDYLEDYNE